MNTDHVVHNAKVGCMECKHCGFQQAVKMPIPIDDMLTTMDAFLAHHGACKVPASETVMSDYIAGFDAGYEYVLQEIERWIRRHDFDPRFIGPVEVLLAHLKMEGKDPKKLEVIA
jgi:hypothetical protein